MRTHAILAVFVIAGLTGLSWAAPYQRKAPPPPRPAPAQKPKPATRPTGTKLFENKEYQFSFRAPAAWTEGSASASLYSLTIVLTPEVSPPPTFQVRAVTPDSPVADVDAAVEWLKKGYTDHNKEAKFREVQATKVGGEDARILTVDNFQSAGSVERTTVMLHNGKLILCVLDANDAKSFQKSQTIADGVVRTLKWLDKKPTPPATQPAAANAPSAAN